VNKYPFIKDTLLVVRKYSKVKSDTNAVYIKSLTDMLLSYIFESLTETEESLPLSIKKYIDENFIKTFNESNLSDYFNYSNSYLTKLFREKYNITPKQYAKQLILENAVSLLKKGLSVQNVAEQLEFSSPENFSRFFKSYYGFCPSQYIKRFKNSPI
jgi:two-component system response regulator YesN